MKGLGSLFKHLSGKHDQQSHGGSGGSDGITPRLIPYDPGLPGIRPATEKELRKVLQDYNDIPKEIRKWNKTEELAVGVISNKSRSPVSWGNAVLLDEKSVQNGGYSKINQHEMRHALIHNSVINANGGQNAMAGQLDNADFRLPILSLKDHVDRVTNQSKYKIDVGKENKFTSIYTGGMTTWSEKEASSAIGLWREWMKIPLGDNKSFGLTNLFPLVQKSISQDMVDHFKQRTELHISLVQKYLQQIIDLNDKRIDNNLLEKEKAHDQSKYEDPEYQPYLHVNWSYHLKDKGEQYDPPQEIKDQMQEATFHHVKNNPHHPEYWDVETTIDSINRADRDKPPEKMANATTMPLSYVAAMVADWMAMSEEKGTNPADWAKANIDKRWKFTDEQKDLIWDLLDSVWQTKKIGLGLYFKGGPGSGNFGHEGREGQVGGSGEGEGQDSRLLFGFAEKLEANKDIFNQIKRAKNWGISDSPIGDRSYFNGDNATMGLNRSNQEKIFDYVTRDKEPSGQIGQVLDKLCSSAEGFKNDALVYRGLRTDKKVIQAIEDKLQNNENVVLQFNRPTSWTNSDSVAFDFAKAKGPRGKFGDSGVVLKVLAPKGIKAVGLDIAFGVGQETLFSSTIKIQIVKIEKYREVVRFVGKMI